MVTDPSRSDPPCVCARFWPCLFLLVLSCQMRLGDMEEELAFAAEDARREARREVATMVATNASGAGQHNLKQRIQHLERLKAEVPQEERAG